ncbi:SDR family NAD(P)-dependent oxidoreductase [Rhodococcus rhodochrous]|uniref:SDR family NAD(P)-dependent oxidoreductase n=1 Tax=Rhodococcus rhodochrous TaxID=1829 RepID=A0AAW4XBZ7_RHORH|nr:MULTISPECIES: oxidoreductase [Rhodococcus]MCD2110207.1 SDR family NAD(P)-dependent oxidoreductase [Rhodococcus rhodochrous]MXQ74759.1 SDR family NAD(P)-dependent oxidoreductase [Rhodococcus rhodochrous]WAL47327.1 oxidoreductase [Rhodococcus pyridinivorans]
MAPDATTSLAGRTVVVTGATSGVGEATARALGAAGATVVLTGRNVDRGKRIADEIGPRAEMMSLDLADLSAIRAFADAFADRRIDILVNNAGVMAVPLRRTADGFEMQMGTNHLGHFALTGLLLPRITGRVVTVSSAAHLIGRIDLDDLNWERRPYNRAAAYAQSKLANLLFALELERRLAAVRSPLRAVAAHPGYAATEVGSHTGTWFDRLFGFGKTILQRTPDQGAESVVLAASDPGIAGGYIGPRFLLYGAPGVAGVGRRARDRETATRLWELSEKLTGVHVEIG